MPPNKAVIDTTVFANALLKQTEDGRQARAAIAAIRETQLPVYAIKEFKAGPLRAYVWLHNRTVVANEWADAVRAIHSVWRQKNLQSTALEALADFQSSISRRLTSELAAKYPNLNVGDALRSEAMIWLKTVIYRAWRARRKTATRIIGPLKCYREAELKQSLNGTIDNFPTKCGVSDCCLREEMLKRPDLIQALLDACDQLPDKAETSKRRQVLRQLRRTPNRLLTESQCRALGDAVFAFQAPNDATILTTNVADHGPLAAAIGLSVVTPLDALK